MSINDIIVMFVFAVTSDMQVFTYMLCRVIDVIFARK